MKRSTRLPARYRGASAADLVLMGLKDILAYERGQISLRTTTEPIPRARCRVGSTVRGNPRQARHGCCSLPPPIRR